MFPMRLANEPSPEHLPRRDAYQCSWMHTTRGQAGNNEELRLSVRCCLPALPGEGVIWCHDYHLMYHDSNMKGYKEKLVDIREEILHMRRAGKLPQGTASILKAWPREQAGL
ncbi:unnamed protein product [Urochloa humidicola]